MTEIRFYARPGEYALEVSGHATGNTEACAGCSAIASMLINACEFEGIKDARYNEDGYVRINAPFPDDERKTERIRAIFEAAVLGGFAAIAQAYPEHVSVKITDEPKLITKISDYRKIHEEDRK